MLHQAELIKLFSLCTYTYSILILKCNPERSASSCFNVQNADPRKSKK